MAEKTGERLDEATKAIAAFVTLKECGILAGNEIKGIDKRIRKKYAVEIMRLKFYLATHPTP